jgi:DNA-binding CsgD family transcriptional regulator
VIVAAYHFGLIISSQATSPMTAALKVSSLLEEIYDAALEPVRWNDVVVGINEFVGTRACGIISKDSISKSGLTHYYCGADPHYIKLYSDEYARLDPLARLPPPGQVVSIPDLVPYDEYRSGRFYQEWLLPQDCLDTPNVLLDQVNSSHSTLLTFLVRDSMMDNDMRRRIALIAPHVKRALMINTEIDNNRFRASALADTLDCLNAGVFLVDSRCCIVHSNAAGQKMLREDDLFRNVGGQLILVDRQANHDLRENILNGEAGIATKNLAYPLTAPDGKHYVAHLLPLRSLMRNPTPEASNAVAAIFVRKAELNSKAYGDLVARAYGLTPAELRVLLAVVEVSGVPEASERLGIAESTVKTHLYRVFSKTGAGRQADLVKLAAGFSNPFSH